MDLMAGQTSLKTMLVFERRPIKYLTTHFNVLALITTSYAGEDKKLIALLFLSKRRNDNKIVAVKVEYLFCHARSRAVGQGEWLKNLLNAA